MKMDVETQQRKTSVRRARPKGQSAKQKKQVGYKSIVVPIDFSETSLKALDFALTLAKEFGSRINLVHVLEFPAVFNSTAQPSYAVWDKEAKKNAATRLAELVDEKVDELITVKYEVRFGRAFKIICDAAREQKADLIVIGTHGFTGLKHLLLGSTAERVIRHAPCSVLTIRSQHARNARSILKLKKILVPTDFSKPADEALRSAIALAQQYSAQLDLLYVVPFRYAVGEYDQVDYQLLAVEEMEAGQKKLAAASKRLLAQKIAVKTKICRGRPATEIIQVSEELGSDLIVIATHGITGWRHALLGSTTEETVRHSTCPVLIARKL